MNIEHPLSGFWLYCAVLWNPRVKGASGYAGFAAD